MTDSIHSTCIELQLSRATTGLGLSLGLGWRGGGVGLGYTPQEGDRRMRVKTDLGGCGTGHVHAAVQELLRFRHVVVLGRIAQLRGEGDHDITMRERRCGREESRHAGMVAQRIGSQGQSTQAGQDKRVSQGHAYESQWSARSKQRDVMIRWHNMVSDIDITLHSRA